MSLFDLTHLSRGILLEDNLNGDDNEESQQQQTDNQAQEEEPADTGDDEDEFSMDDGNDSDDSGDNDVGDESGIDSQSDSDSDEDEFSMEDDSDDGGAADGDGDADDSGDSTEPGGQGAEKGAGDSDEDEFSMDGDDDGNDGGDSDADNSTDDSDNTDTDVESDDPNEKLKALEKSIFDTLSPEQQSVKIKELKSLYTDVHVKSQSVIDMVSTSNKDPIHVKVYDYIMNTLLDLQKYIKDYLTDIFDSKTYIENLSELQKYISVLDTVSNVFEEVRKDSEVEK